jgi:hypothetical protein
VKQITSPNLAFGGVVHQALEYFHKNHKLIKSVDIKTLLDVFEFKWKSRINDTDQPVVFTKFDNNAYFEVGADILTQYHKLHKDDNPPLIVLFETSEGFDNTPAVELPFEIFIDKDIPPIIGYIDLISFNDKQAIIEDHKTGASIYNDFFVETDTQLILYSAAFRNLLENKRLINPLTGDEYTNPEHKTQFNLFIKKMPTKKQPEGKTQIELLGKEVSLDDIAHVKGMIKMMHNGIKNDIFLPNYAKPYERHCLMCEYQEECKQYKIGK